MFKEIANGAKIQVLPIIPIYAKVSKRRKIRSKQLPTHQLKTNVMNCYEF